MEIEPKDPWWLSSPYPRVGIPTLAAGLVGLFTNLVSGIGLKNGVTDWSVIVTSPLSYFTLILIVLSAVYQVAIFKFDKRQSSVLEKAKEKQLAAVAAYYQKKIEAGEIDDLLQSDEKLRKIFGGTL